MFREEVIRRHPRHRIVILPQTVHFQSTEKVRQAQDVFGGHPNLTIMLRDRISFEFCSRHFSSNEIKLVPDMSHLLWPLAKPAGAPEGTLYLLRRDREIHPEQKASGQAHNFRDWKDLMSWRQYGRLAIFRAVHHLDRILGNRLPVYAGWYDLVCALTERLIDLFSAYRCIVSSRLHGHLLACLLDKPNVLLDNSYGKNSAYFRTWTWQVPAASLGTFADLPAP
jgi:pyruvyl transferase EpsO